MARSTNLALIALFTALAALIASSQADAAEVIGSVDLPTILVGEQAIISIDLVLDPAASEVASVFEGIFDFTGLGTIGSASVLTAGVQADWSSAFQNIFSGQGISSLTSATNMGGQRMVAQYAITGLAVGTFDVRLGLGTFAGMDLNSPPFFADVPLATLFGATLAQIQVVSPGTPVPEPGTALLFVIAVVGKLAIGKKQRAA